MAQQVLTRTSAPGAERFILSLALMVPLTVTILAVLQLTGANVSVGASALSQAVATPTSLVAHRPVSSNAAPPPTLVPPTPTPKPEPTAVAAAPAGKPAQPATAAGTYTVEPGDELKGIAATYGVSIWKIIAANDIPNPDSLRVGQQLKIPQ